MAQVTVGTATRAEDYLNRPAERLVIEGYRLLAGATSDGGTPSLSGTLCLYQNELGVSAGAEAAAALERFMTSLKACAINPLTAYRPGSRFISPDEVLVLGIICGIQHWDEQIFRVCLTQLCAKTDLLKVAASAETFAMTLRNCGVILTPLPLSLRARITHLSETKRHTSTGATTLH